MIDLHFEVQRTTKNDSCKAFSVPRLWKELRSGEHCRGCWCPAHVPFRPHYSAPPVQPSPRPEVSRTSLSTLSGRSSRTNLKCWESTSPESSTSAQKRHAGHQLSARLGTPRSVTGDGGGGGGVRGHRRISHSRPLLLSCWDRLPSKLPTLESSLHLHLERGTRGGRHFNLSTSA